MIKGQIIAGEFGRILARQKSDTPIEIGELLVAQEALGRLILLQAYDLVFGSQVSAQNLELISGLRLEEDPQIGFLDEHLKNYTIAHLKSIVTIQHGKATSTKTLPSFFSDVREVKKEDLRFLSNPQNPLSLGSLRSGSKSLDVPICLDGELALSHHVLIAATTGRGKSNLMCTILWDVTDKPYCGMLVLDPHDEYYGKGVPGLSCHPARDKVSYYTSKDPPPGARTLRINIEIIRPSHFDGVLDWSGPQLEALRAYHKKYGTGWIEAVVLEKPLGHHFHEGTLGVVRRRIMNLLNLDFSDNQLFCNGIFVINGGETVVNDIVMDLEDAKTVIVDTSQFGGPVEILIGGIIAREALRRRQQQKNTTRFARKPVISIVLEEAPRVLGKDVLEKGPNVFSTIAREGRKFKVGLCAITQLPSLIPRQILANMNTKIILGIEMATERQAIIESASQDLSTDSRAIASLDRGEAIVSSNFAAFAYPIKIPLFDDIIKSASVRMVDVRKAAAAMPAFDGVKLT